MTVRYTANEWREQAAEAKLTIDKYMDAIAVHEQKQQELQSGRRSTEDEKARIDKALDELNGQVVSGNLSTDDVLATAGVRKVQGTASYATRGIKRLLVVYPTSAQASH